MKLYLVITERHTSGYNGGSDTIEYIEGVFRDDKKAQEFINKELDEYAYIKSVESDLFEG